MDTNRTLLLAVAAMCVGVLVYLILRKRRDMFEGFTTTEAGTGDMATFKMFGNYFIEMAKALKNSGLSSKPGNEVKYTVEQRYAMMEAATKSFQTMPSGPSLIIEANFVSELASETLKRYSLTGEVEPWVPTFNATITKCKTLKKLFADNEQPSNNQTSKYYVSELAKAMFVEFVNTNELTFGVVDVSKPITMKTTALIEPAGDLSGNKVTVNLLDVEALIANPLSIYLKDASMAWTALSETFKSSVNYVLSGSGPEFNPNVIGELLFAVEITKGIAVHYVIMLNRLNVGLDNIISIFDLIKPGSNLSKSPIMSTLFNANGARNRY